MRNCYKSAETRLDEDQWQLLYSQLPLLYLHPVVEHLKVSISFVISADAVKAYDMAKEYFLKRGYNEQNAIKPMLLVFKRREDSQNSASSNTEYCRVGLRTSFSPVGDLQLYSEPLLTVRCEYEVKCTGEASVATDRVTFENEIDQLKCYIQGQPQKFKPERNIPFSGRVSTGHEDLDNLMLGGIPERYAIILTSPSCDEKDMLIKKFLETGAKTGQETFYITAETGKGVSLAENFQSNFYLFICNPHAEATVRNLPKVFKLKGVESLTDIDIALVKAYRMTNPSQKVTKRACIEILSDVLLQQHAVVTRKWLTGLLTKMQAEGFTTLAVINPQMHPQEEVQAILDLFQGELKISEKETPTGTKKTLQIKKLLNHQYHDQELTLKREFMEDEKL
jgi:KaiC/GvpD/RAD55 family RecA-like ATPase